ncbi:MAG TPA: metallophosphoesterase family protein [Candidatus Acidoferrum sp.]|jgi:putative phosphoesterase|nr:metallophosphoesterase family protein [Candidatus Acidoferrum sp.]
MHIGVISDTHNYFDLQIPRLFAGVEHILHGGDIGTPSILLELRQIAPVTAVSGNTDEPGFGYPLTQTLELAGRKFLLHHIVNPAAPDDALRERLAQERPDVVVFGHTHKPFCETIQGTLFFNPGYAGKSRFGMERTVAILESGGKSTRSEYFKL